MHSQTSKVVWLGLPRPMFFLKNLVSLNFTSWNQIGEWLRRVEALRYAA
jgi:hypothetical protein